LVFAWQLNAPIFSLLFPVITRPTAKRNARKKYGQMMEERDRGKSQLQTLAVRSIVGKVLTLDEAYHAERIAKAQSCATADSASAVSNNHLQWRQALLQERAAKLIHLVLYWCAV
jgi:hypothetical protein